MSVPNAPMATPRPTSPVAATAVIRSGSPHATEIRREVAQGRVGNGLHQRLERGEVRVAGAALVGLEQQHLLAQVSLGLTPEIGDDLRGIAAAVGSVAHGA